MPISLLLCHARRDIMAIPSELKKRLEKKQEELIELEGQVRETRAYIQALQDTIKMYPKEEQDIVQVPESNIRSGSLVAKARDVLKKKGTAMHVSDILKAIGQEDNKERRLSV